MPPTPLDSSRSARTGSVAARPGRLQWVLLGFVLAAYSLLSWYSSANPAARGLGAGLSLGPVLLIGVALLRRWAHPLAATAATTLLGAALYRYWPQLENHFEWADLVQQSGIFGLLAASFARSLFAGRTPWCTQLADRLHGPLLPDEVAYTRRATVAWSIFYALLTVAIILLFFTAPLNIWSLFVNFATYGLIVLMFAADHAIRSRVLPHRPRSGLLTSLRQFLIG